MQETNFSTITGKGIYPIPMVAKLVGVSVQSIYSWVRSFESFQNSLSSKKPIWKPEVFYFEGHKYLTFRDLLELRIISIFKKHKINYRILASLSEVLSLYYQTEYPFISSRLSTDGTNIYIKDNLKFPKVTNIYDKKILLPHIEKWMEKEIVELDNGELKIVQPFSKNKINQILGEYNNIIDNEIVFDEKKPVEWCIDADSFGDVCLNPEYHAGYPIVDFIPTATIYDLSESGMDIDEISAMYSLEKHLVKQAIRFEREYLH